jgi:hypothetical protein|tara:strand:- start:911 stop:1276 length:366 start_codon:yes stop_codon:yes gene_type:complete
MPRRTKVAFISLLLVTIAACNNLPDTIYQEFIPIVTDQGLQLFTYKAVLDVPSKARKSRFATQDLRPKKTRNKIERQAIAALEAQLKQSNYCQHGYFIIDKFIQRTKLSIKGECKSVAIRD